jgi:hypothetical protein
MTAFRSFFESELRRLALLPENWDRYGAPAIDPKIIEVARNVVRELPESMDKSSMRQT